VRRMTVRKCERMRKSKTLLDGDQDFEQARMKNISKS